MLHLSNNDGKEEGTKQPHIVIVGGGFGGVNTALTLPTLPWSDNNGESMKPKITLIDKSEGFIFLPLLYELCVEDARLDGVAPIYKSLLDGTGTRGFASLSGLPDLAGAFELFSGDQKEKEESDDGCEVSFLQGQVEGIDAQKQQVVLSKSDDSSIETIDCDALVIATGSEIPLDAIPGASEYALLFYIVEHCWILIWRTIQPIRNKLSIL